MSGPCREKGSFRRISPARRLRSHARLQFIESSAASLEAFSQVVDQRLYEKAGMHVVEQVNRYEKTLRTGVDRTARPA
jgi:hypothetical protein